MTALRPAALGRTYADALAAIAIADAEAERAEPDGPLRRRERDVLRLVADGHTDRQAGTALGVSENTVKTHLRHAFRKLGARSRAHAVHLAWQKGILP